MSTEAANLPDQPTPRDQEGFSENESPKIKRKISRGPSLDNEGFSSPRNSPDKPFTPKGSLFKLTQSRMKEVEATEAKMKEMQELREEETLKRALSFTKEVKTDAAKKGGPSERLLKTTQARIIDTRELELRKDRIDASQDIWWDIRKQAELASKRPGVQSKLYEPTVAYLASNRTKHPLKKASFNGLPETPEKEHVAVQKINEESPLLKPTRSSVIGMYGKDLSVLEEVPTFQPTLLTTNDNVKSKLLEPTRAMDAGKYKSKEQIAEEEAAEIAAAKAAAPKVKDVSERLVTLNANLKHSSRPKLIKTEGDPREEGWKSEYGQAFIPEPEPVVFPNRRHSTTPNGKLSRRSSKAGFNTPERNGSAPMNVATEAVAPTEAPEDGMEVTSGAPETNDEM